MMQQLRDLNERVQRSLSRVVAVFAPFGLTAGTANDIAWTAMPLVNTATTHGKCYVWRLREMPT